MLLEMGRENKVISLVFSSLLEGYEPKTLFYKAFVRIRT